MPTRIFLVDDQEIIRRGVKDVLWHEGDLEVVGEAGSAEEAIKGIAATRPDIAVLDVQLGPGEPSGIEVCRQLRVDRPELTCLMLTSFAEDEALFAAIMAGAAGYVLKWIDSQALISAIRRLAEGGSLLDPAVTARVLERIRNPDPTGGPLDVLTEQQRRILTLISEGKTNRQIAEVLSLAEKTVKNYVSTLLAKLGMVRRSEAAAFAARLSAEEPRAWH